jgi:tryptophan synthase alpha chain
MNRLEELFKEKKQSGEKVMNLYVTAGYPTKDTSAELILKLDEAGADIIELGMPFSDPLADGPTIQESSNEALKQGVDLQYIFDLVKKVRESSEIPIVLMGYINPVLSLGVENFCAKAADCGADGLIIPDVPLEEAQDLKSEAEKAGLTTTFLVAPNSTDERMQRIDEASSGFVYCVSVTGVTGARSGEEVQNSVQRFIDRVTQNVTKNPVLIGFGIKSHSDAIALCEKTDGFIVGSALIDFIKNHYPNENWLEDTAIFVRHLKHGD